MELKVALQTDRVMSQVVGDQTGPPSFRTLALIAAAAGLPYVGFGFVSRSPTCGTLLKSQIIAIS